MEHIVNIIARELGLPTQHVRGTIDLLVGGATVPFISRYRKEVTGAMDEVKIATVLDRMLELQEVKHRKEYILSSIDSQNKLTDELRAAINTAWSMTELEDIYLPFKPRRRTRAQVARENGLESLAKIILSQNPSRKLDCGSFLSDKVVNESDAIDGAKDIIAEWVNEDTASRNIVRKQFQNTALVSVKVVKGKEKDAAKYRDFFDWQRPLSKVAGHRLLALRRGEAEGFLKVDISPSPSTIERLCGKWTKGNGRCSDYVADAVKDAYSRLLKPAIEREFAADSKHRADLEAIDVFARNLRQLLLSSPLGGRRMIAIDPGFRTGCKTVVLDEQGNLLHHTVIYPQGKSDQVVYAEMQLLKLIDRYDIQAIAIGSGTAGRETREFIESIEPGENIEVYMVNEDGASVYSASAIAREEFPDEDVTVRGAVSIGRRLMDPLSELVKISPESIGVGQYQHDVDSVLLRRRLHAVTESCVNSVGVNLNTAGKEILTYVSGLGPSLARSIVDFRAVNGAFTSRAQLKKVPRLGEKAFEQCAAFLRIPGAANPLDNSAVHPERYKLVAKIAADLNVTIADLISKSEVRQRIDISKYIDETTGEATLIDILAELAKPGRDPRAKLQQQHFNDNIRKIDDITEGMQLPGVVSNITAFGAFIDLGIKTKGLLHVSQLPLSASGNKKITNPSAILSVGQQLTVKVIGVDLERGRIALSMRF